MFDGKFSTVQNDTRLENTTVESISKDLFTDCRDYFGEDGRPPDVTIVPKGGTTVNPPPELGGELLPEVERCDKSSRDEEWRARQHKFVFNRQRILRDSMMLSILFDHWMLRTFLLLLLSVMMIAAWTECRALMI